MKIDWRNTTPEQRAASAFARAREIDLALPRIAAPIPPWAPSLLKPERAFFWGLPKKLRRVA